MGRQRSDSAVRLAVACKVLYVSQPRTDGRTINRIRSHGRASHAYLRVLL